MKRKIYGILVLLGFFALTSCNDWLNVLPDNEQVTDNYWKR